MGNMFAGGLLDSILMSGFPEVTDEQARYAMRPFIVEGMAGVFVIRICQVKCNRYAALDKFRSCW